MPILDKETELQTERVASQGLKPWQENKISELTGEVQIS